MIERLELLAAAVLAGLLVGLALAFIDTLRQGPVPAAPGPALRPAPWEVSQLLEEARRITGEAT